MRREQASGSDHVSRMKLHRPVVCWLRMKRPCSLAMTPRSRLHSANELNELIVLLPLLDASTKHSFLGSLLSTLLLCVFVVDVVALDAIRSFV